MYPAQDNLDMREGTFECWVRLGFEPSEGLPAAQYTGFLTFLGLEGENGGLNLSYQAQGGTKEPGWACSMHPSSYFTTMLAAPELWRKGEWHHFALVWKGADTILYTDGKVSGAYRHERSLFLGFGPVATKQIFIGGKWGVNAMMTVDELRLSRVARKPEELGFHGPLKPDVYTSILDSFEGDFTPDGKTSTQPAVMLSGQGGTASSPCQFVEGKYGKALSFYKQQ